MHIKSFVSGLAVGAVIGCGVFWIFGDSIRGRVADTTGDFGRTIKQAGQTIQNKAKKLDN